MHEVSIASSIMKTVEEELKNIDTDEKLKIVKLKIGKIHAVIPEALHFAWNVITGNTGLEGSSLEIEEIPIILKCSDCGNTTELHDPVFICPDCGSFKTTVIQGEELDIISMIIE